MKLKIGFVSLGCPKNLTDTETMIGIVAEDHEIVANPEDADIIIINTCGFIDDAKQESIDTIIEMGKYKEMGSLSKLVVTGCLAQRYADEIFDELPEVDAVVGTSGYNDIKDIIEQVLADQKVRHLPDINREIKTDAERILATPPYSAYLKIADGCDNKCTYCIIPKLRGKYRSRPIENIISEAEKLAEKGVTELILIAQDTSNYGVDLYDRQSLHILIEELSKIEKIKWIRVHYCYPEYIYPELIDVMAKNEKVCKYLDIPIQHASDAVLKRMGRKTTRNECETLIKTLREKIPEIVLRSTFITGFPGETEEDFAELYDFIEKMRFDRVGVFSYSAEEGTAAAKLPGQIEQEIKDKRRNKLMMLQQKISYECNQKKIGTIITVLTEEMMGGQYVGRTMGDSPEIDGSVIFDGGDIKAGEYVKVKITHADQYDLKGEQI
ncbi:MAG: 30S ribosomal protein S12 methylthiotransferase RimO [Clostridia bacterium]|nr:30S ribosomal protein S12 methylthiotransferase RimO [Clostridia bacterium]